MTEQQLERQIRSVVSTIDGDMGDVDAVMARARSLRRTNRFKAMIAVAAAVLGLAGTVTAAMWWSGGDPGPDGVISPPDGGPSLSLVIEPGQGTGELAERLVTETGLGAIPGTATHVGTVQAMNGRHDVIEFSSVDAISVAGALVPFRCRAVVTDMISMLELSCRRDGDHDEGGWGRDNEMYWVDAEVPEGTAVAVVTTTAGRTIEVRTSGVPVLFAPWPTGRQWGPPASLEFIDAGGGVIQSIDYR